jgi:hypothetical protein
MHPEAAKYFTRKPGTPARLLSTKHGLIDFRTMTLKRAVSLWKDGFDKIELTDEGVKKYTDVSIPLPDDQLPELPATAKEIANAMKLAENEQQLHNLLQAKPESVIVKAAYEKRMSEISAIS